MAKVLGFKIEILGEKVAIETATDIRNAISDINKALKKTSNPKEVQKLESELIDLKGALKEVNAQQRQSINEFTRTAEGVGAYRKLNAELAVARQKYKDLAAAGDEFTKEAQDLLKVVGKLDRQLKIIDADVGQFQRNVGNYPETIGSAIQQSLPFLGDLKGGFEEIGKISSQTGKLIASSFFVFTAIDKVASAIPELKRFADEFKEVRRQVNATTGATGEALDNLTTKIKAAAETFEVEFDDTLTASNALIQKFGTEGSEAVDLIGNGLAAVGNRTKFLGLVEAELKKLTGIGIDDESAIALLVQASNRNFDVDVLAEPLIALREQTPAAVEALERAFGRERTKELFSTFREEPIKGIQEISSELAKLDSTAPEVGAVLADVFKAAGEDDITTVLNLKELDSDLIQLLESTGAFSEKQLELLRANEILIDVQNEVSQELTGASEAYDLLSVNLKTKVLQSIISFIQTIRAIPEFIRENKVELIALGTALIGFNANLIAARAATIAQNIAQKRAIIVTQAQAAAQRILNVALRSNPIGLVITAVAGLIFIFKKAYDRSLTLRAGIAGLSNVAKEVLTIVKEALGGFVTAFNQLKEGDVSGAFSSIGKSLTNLNPIGLAFTQGKRLKEAYAKGFKERILEEQSAASVADELKNATEEAAGSIAPGDNGVLPSGGNQTSKQLKERQKNRERLLEEDLKFEEKRKAILAKLSKKIVETQLELIEDGREKELEIIKAKHTDRLKELDNQAKELQTQTKEREAKILVAFGEGSEELKAFRQRSESDLAELQTQTNELKLAETERFEREKLKIKERFDNDDKARQLKAVREELELLDSGFALEESKLKTQLAKKEIDQKEFDERIFKERKSNLLRQIDELNKSLLDLDGAEIDQKEIDKIIFQRQKLNEELAKLDNERTENEKKESEERGEGIRDEIEKILGYAQQAIDIFSQFQDVQRDRELAAIDERIEGQERYIQRLESSLEKATGAEKKRIEKQLEQERTRLERSRRQREETEEKFARRQKAIAILQSIINTALAVTKALPKIPLAIATGVIGAAQTAIIAAQPLARGGVVTPVQLSGERVTTNANIPELQNGDNVLATVRRGEVVLNDWQQRLLGGASTFKAIGVPGFASGGILGAPITAPNVPSGGGNQEFKKLIESIDKKTDMIQQNVNATNGRIDRLRAIVVSDDIADDLADRDNLRVEATFG